MTMTDQISARLALPLLAAGQAGKEVTHNEALTRLDMLVQPAVAGIPMPRTDRRLGGASGCARRLDGWRLAVRRSRRRVRRVELDVRSTDCLS
jgi:hypothetical protein